MATAKQTKDVVHDAAAAPEEVVNVVVEETASVTPGRFFTIPGRDPFDEIEWELRDAIIPGKDGPAFEQRNVEFPRFWSQTATNIVAQKYFRGRLSSPERERSVKQMIGRVVDTIGGWGRAGGYFATDEEADTFEAELKAILVNQYASFNSPVWFNVGFEEKPQCSACFILSIDDSMESILDWIRREGVIFRGGSGSGPQPLEAALSKEQLSKGGYASGPVSFMRGADASAGTIKSGGKTRRAAKMVVLDVDHPDIEEFIWCKAKEERKARPRAGRLRHVARLTGLGLDPVPEREQLGPRQRRLHGGGAGEQGVEPDRPHRRYGRRVDRRTRAAAADRRGGLQCADPGVQYDTTINAWHTLPNTGRINASNPCSEYMSIDDSACNLSSLNLMKFRREDGEFDVTAFEHAVDVMFLAQEICVGYSSYPTPEIDRNAKAYRQLGLGYEPRRAADGAGLPVRLRRRPRLRGGDHGADDRPRLPQVGRDRPADGPVRRLPAERGRDDRRDREAPGRSREHPALRFRPDDLLSAARQAWDDALDKGEVSGYRNAQATVLAPTGTISFMMDCDTTGVADFSLVKSKKLVGGGEITIVNKTVPMALDKLGYAPSESRKSSRSSTSGTRSSARRTSRASTTRFRLRDRRACDPLHGSREDDGRRPAVHLRCDLEDRQPARGGRRGSVAAPDRILAARRQAIAIYRDNCKVAQPLSARPTRAPRRCPRSSRSLRPRSRSGGGCRRIASRSAASSRSATTRVHPRRPLRGRHPATSSSTSPRRATLAGLMNSFMISVSLGLQYGVPLEVYVSKFSHMRFEPGGLTNDADIRVAKSIVDYIFRWMGKKFLTSEQQEEAGILTAEVKARLAQAYATGEAAAPAARHRRRARPPSSIPGRTRSSAPSAAAAWCAQARATRAATAARTLAAARS